MKNLISILTALAFLSFATPSFSQDSDYERFWKSKISEIFNQFRSYKDAKRISVQTINGQIYLIKYLRTDRGGMIQVYPAEVNKQTKTIFVDSKKKRFYKWEDDGDKFIGEDELIPDKRKNYFGLEPPPRYLPEISRGNCA